MQPLLCFNSKDFLRFPKGTRLTHLGKFPPRLISALARDLFRIHRLETLIRFPWRSCVERPRFFLHKGDISSLNIKANYANEYLTRSSDVKGNYANESGETGEKGGTVRLVALSFARCSKEERRLNSREIPEETERRKSLPRF